MDAPVGGTHSNRLLACAFQACYRRFLILLGKSKLSRLHAVEELTDLGFKAFGFDSDQIGKVLDARRRRTSAAGHFGHAGHRLRPDASLVRCPADAFRDRCDGRTLLINGRGNGCGNRGHFPDDHVNLRDGLRGITCRRLD